MRKTLIATALAATLTLTGTAAAALSGAWQTSQGVQVSTSWTQVDGPPAADASTQPFGNVHVGWLDVWRERGDSAYVWAYIDDFRCPTGVLPDHGGGHEEEPTDGCEYVGSRFGEGEDMTLAIGSQLRTARLRGQLVLSADGHGGGDGSVVGRPAVDVTWTAHGKLWSDVSTFRSTRGSGYAERYRTNNRDARMSGRIGAMGFDRELSEGTVSRYWSSYRDRLR